MILHTTFHAEQHQLPNASAIIVSKPRHLRPLRGMQMRMFSFYGRAEFTSNVPFFVYFVSQYCKYIAVYSQAQMIPAQIIRLKTEKQVTTNPAVKKKEFYQITVDTHTQRDSHLKSVDMYASYCRN